LRAQVFTGDIFLRHAEEDEQHQHGQLVEHLAHQVHFALALDPVDEPGH
jgi:hypothetical protein